MRERHRRKSNGRAKVEVVWEEAKSPDAEARIEKAFEMLLKDAFLEVPD